MNQNEQDEQLLSAWDLIRKKLNTENPLHNLSKDLDNESVVYLIKQYHSIKSAEQAKEIEELKISLSAEIAKKERLKEISLKEIERLKNKNERLDERLSFECENNGKILNSYNKLTKELQEVREKADNIVVAIEDYLNAKPGIANYAGARLVKALSSYRN